MDLLELAPIGVSASSPGSVRGNMSEAARGCAAGAIEHGYPEIKKFEAQLEMLEQQLKNLSATHSGTRMSEAARGSAAAIEHGIQKVEAQLEMLEQQHSEKSGTVPEERNM